MKAYFREQKPYFWVIKSICGNVIDICFVGSIRSDNSFSIIKQLMQPRLYSKNSVKPAKKGEGWPPSWSHPGKTLNINSFNNRRLHSRTVYRTNRISPISAMTVPAMTFGSPLGKERFRSRLAHSECEVAAAQKLRHRIFFGEVSQSSKHDHRDSDILDSHCDHLIVLDQYANGRMVGVCRLIRQQAAEQAGNFYSAGRYDLTPLLSYPGTLLELGRFCIDPAYRDGAVSRLLWKGLSRYIARFGIDLIFGCASLPGTQQHPGDHSLSYLHYYHAASAPLRARALPSLHVSMDRIPYRKIDKKQAFSRLPPLIKAYLRIGCKVGDGAVIDHDFGTTDVLVIGRITALATRYRLMGLEQNRPAASIPTALQVSP